MSNLAQKLREKAINFTNDSNQKQYDRIVEKCDKEASNGKMETTFFEHINDSVQRKLQSEGIVVGPYQHSQKDSEEWHIICWGK